MTSDKELTTNRREDGRGCGNGTPVEKPRGKKKEI